MKWTAALAAIVLTVLLLSTAELAFANPVAAPIVNVQSPINNQIYPTNEVELKATANVFPSPVNLTIKYYILDNQPSILTNGTAVLSNLSPGSHTLELYGTWSDYYANSTHESNDALVSIVYFSVIYSTQWVTFSVILALVITVIGLALYWKRRQIKAAIRSKKSGVFFVGLALLLVSILPLMFFVWQRANFYLFPHWR